MIRFFITEHRRNPWVLPGVALTGCAALGAALNDILAVIHQVLS